MFARFHYSIRPKAIVKTAILTNLGGNAAGFPTELNDLVLKTTSTSEIQENDKQEQHSP